MCVFVCFLSLCVFYCLFVCLFVYVCVVISQGFILFGLSLFPNCPFGFHNHPVADQSIFQHFSRYTAHTHAAVRMTSVSTALPFVSNGDSNVSGASADSANNGSEAMCAWRPHWEGAGVRASERAT